MSTHEDFEPKLKKKRTTSNNSENTRLLFIDGLNNHYYNSLLCTKLSSQSTIICFNDAQLVVPSSSLNTFDLGLNLICAQIHQSNRWFITVNKIDDYDDGSMIRVFNLDGGEQIFCKVLPMQFVKILLLESKNVMYLVTSETGFCKMLLDIDLHFPILDNQTESNVFDRTIRDLTYSKDDLIVLNGHNLEVFDEQTLKFKYSKLIENNPISVHYNKNNDELITFHPEVKSFRIYCEENYDFYTNYNFSDMPTTSTTCLEFLYDMEFCKMFVLKDDQDLILVDKSTLIPLKILHIPVKDVFFDKKTKTILGIMHNNDKSMTVTRFKLELDTHSIDIPLDLKIVEKLKEIGAKVPNYFLTMKNIPDSISYLTQIMPNKIFNYYPKHFYNLTHKIYDIFNEKLITNVADIGLDYPFTFQMVDIHMENELMAALFHDEIVYYIGANNLSNYFYIGVKLSECGQFNDFPIYIVSKKFGFDMSFTTCKLSDFVQTLSLRACTIIENDNKIKGYSFDLDFIYETLKNNSKINPTNLEINNTSLREAYQQLVNDGKRKKTDKIRQILSDFKYENIKINGKWYSIWDLLTLTYGMGQLNPYLTFNKI